MLDLPVPELWSLWCPDHGKFWGNKHDCCFCGYQTIQEPDMSLPQDPAKRKALPITTGVLDYFPDAIAEVARVSVAGNDQHNPGEPLHWARGKSMDQADCIARHLLERGTIDVDGLRHSAKLAWRALALLQLELEAERPVVGANLIATDFKTLDEWNQNRP